MVWVCDESVTPNARAPAKPARTDAVVRVARIIIIGNPIVMTKPVPVVPAILVGLVAMSALAPAVLVSRGESTQRGATDRPEQDWPYYGGDQGGAKYSALADVNTTNVGRLTRTWEW